MLQVNNVVKRFGNHVANNGISLSVSAGRIFGLLGPNGAGKTTLIRMITNIILPDEGTITLEGAPVGPPQQNIIGYLPEERGLYKKMKVGEQLAYFGRLKGLGASEATRRGLWWLNRLNAAGWESRKVQELSKGMQQKVQFIATILHEPKLLILDEPFSGLDPVNSDLLIDVIHELQARGTTIVLSTHQMDQVERLCDDIALVNKGTVVLDGTLRTIKNRYRSDMVLLEFDGDGTPLHSIPHTTVEEATNGHVMLRLGTATTPNDVLRRAMEVVSIRQFVVKEPSLHEIFVQTVTT